MTNAHKVRIDYITLDLDKPRKFRFNLGSLNALEKKLGKKALKEIDWFNPGSQDITLIAWAGLIKDDPTLTIEHLEEVIDLPTLIKLKSKASDIIMQLTGSAIPSVEDLNELTGEPDKDSKNAPAKKKVKTTKA